MTGNGSDMRPDRGPAPDAGSLDAALAALAAAAPPPLSEEFLNRVAGDARREHESRLRAAPRVVHAPLRGDPRMAARPARGGLRARIAAGAVGIAASGCLGFFAGWSDLAGGATPGFADADLVAAEAALLADWEDAL
jgi:hypothetical protein